MAVSPIERRAQSRAAGALPGASGAGAGAMGSKQFAAAQEMAILEEINNRALQISLNFKERKKKKGLDSNYAVAGKYFKALIITIIF